jgi:hypothetical protein
MDIRTGRHVVYLLHAHLVFVTKRRVRRCLRIWHGWRRLLWSICCDMGQTPSAGVEAAECWHTFTACPIASKGRGTPRFLVASRWVRETRLCRRPWRGRVPQRLTPFPVGARQAKRGADALSIVCPPLCAPPPLAWRRIECACTRSTSLRDTLFKWTLRKIRFSPTSISSP